MKAVLLVVAALALAGCTIPVQTTLSKTVVTEKDPQGNILRITETEEVNQIINLDGVLSLERIKFINQPPPKKEPDFPPQI